MSQKFTAEEVRARFETWVSSQPWFAATIGLTMTHDAYTDPCINSRWQGFQAAYADTLSQTADSGRADANCMDVLRRLRDMLPTVGICGWPAGVSALDEAISTLAAQGQGEVACHRFVGPTGEVVTEWEDGLPDNGKRFPDLCPPVSSVQYAYFHPAPAASPAGVPDEVARVAQHMAMAVEYIEKQYPDAAQLDRGPIMRNLRRWRDRLLAAAPSAPEGDGGAE